MRMGCGIPAYFRRQSLAVRVTFAKAPKVTKMAYR